MISLPDNLTRSDNTPFLIFTKDDIKRITPLLNTKEYKYYYNFIQESSFADPSKLFNPRSAATNIEKKHHPTDFRYMGYEIKLFSLGILWKLSGDPKCVEEAIKSINEIIYYGSLLNSTSNTNNNNISSGAASVIRGLSVIIDVMKDALEPAIIKKTVRYIGYISQRLIELIYIYNDGKKPNDDLLIDIGSALGFSSMLLYDLDERAQTWLTYSHSMVMNYLENIPKDGSHTDGLLNWNYTIHSAIMYITALYNFCNIDLRNNQALERAKHFPLDCASPHAKDVLIMSNGLSTKSCRQLSGISSKILAKWFNDNSLAWLIQAGKDRDNIYSPIEIIHLDYPKDNIIPPINGSKNIAGYAILRSGYSDNDNMVALKSSGPTITNHRDQNSIQIFTDNVNIIMDSGIGWKEQPNYLQRYKNTDAHSTILIDGKEQSETTEDARGNIIDFYTSENIDYTCGDASGVYEKAEKFYRNILFIKPNILIIYDCIKLKAIGNVEWLWHGEGKFFVDSSSKPKSFTIQGNKKLTAFILKPQKWSYKLKSGYQTSDWFYGKEITHPVFIMKKAYSISHNMLAIIKIGEEEYADFSAQYDSNKNSLIINQNSNTYNIQITEDKLTWSNKNIN